MSADLTTEIVRIIPSILWVLLVIGLVAAFYRPIRYDLLPRISTFKAAGVEITLAKEQLNTALNQKVGTVNASQRQQLLGSLSRRIERIQSILPGALILWVDDNPGNNLAEIRTLSFLGIHVEQARTSDEALSLLSQRNYNVIITDINRGENPKEGLQFLRTVRERGLYHPLIFYVGHVEPTEGVPAYAFGITDRPDELMHLVLDALARERS